MQLPENDRIYLDHAATTPPSLESIEAMENAMSSGAWGNASSTHSEGQKAKRVLDGARETISNTVGAKFSEIVFTSGGTESDNLAVIGATLAGNATRRRVIVSSIEHEAVLRSSAFLGRLGYDIVECPVDMYGVVDADALSRLLQVETVLVSIMHANNEVGTVQDIPTLARLAHAHGALFHCDAVQTYGSLPVNVDVLGIDLLSISSHKIYGPKGAGALYVRTGTPIEPTMHGGTQERERRGGTENTAAIAGFSAAAQIAVCSANEESARLSELRDRFTQSLLIEITDVWINGHPERRLPNNIHFSVKGLRAEALLVALDMAGISASSGSACTSGSIEPSHVLTAMQLPQDRLDAPIRLSLGRNTTAEQLDKTLVVLSAIVRSQRRQDSTISQGRT